MGMGMGMGMGNRSSYYAVLGVRPGAGADEVRAAYRRMAMKWHPDRWRRQPQRMVEEANRRFQYIQEAYGVLSDQRKRSLYDAGIYDPLQDDEGEVEEVEGFSEFVQEMLTLMAEVRREEREYSLEELQQMLAEMRRSFESPAQPSPPSTTCWFEVGGGSRGSKRTREGTNSTARTRPRVQVSGVEVFGTTSCC